MRVRRSGEPALKTWSSLAIRSGEAMAVIAVPKMFRDGEHHRSQRQSAPRIFNRGIEIDVEADPNGGYPGKHYRNSAAALFSQIVRFTAFLLIELIGRF